MKTFYIKTTATLIAGLSILFSERAHAQSLPLGNVYDVQWTNPVGVSINGGTVTKTSSTNGWNAGASSVNVLPANTDGWMEFQLLSSGIASMIGFSTADVDATQASIAFGVNPNGCSIYESGTQKVAGSGALAAWEVIRIERIAGHIYFKRNGTIIYTSTQTSTSSLIVDNSLYVSGTTVTNVTCSFGAPSQQPLSIQPKNAVWQNAVNASVNSSNTLTKTTSDGWNAGASTLSTLNPNTSGWIQFTLDNTMQQKAVGLSRTDADANYASIDYALVVNGSTVSVMLAGVSQYSFTAATNDVLRVERSGSSILFKQNGNTLYTVNNAYSTSLIGDVSIYTNGATLTSVQTSFWIPYTQGNAPDQYELAALKALYDSLGGSAWTRKTNWPAAGNWPSSATSAQMGTWQSLVVSGCDVTSISMTGNNVTGKLPAAIKLLSSLKVLNMISNKLSGNLPAEVGSLKALTNLTLSANKLSGTLPSLAGLTNLAYLDLSSNNLTGPGQFSLNTLCNLTNLASVNLSGIPLGGTIPSNIGNLKKLTTLKLSNCSLTGSLPAELGSITTLTNLTLSQNQLTGAIPAQFANLTNLTSLYLNVNQLTGSLPSLAGMTQLQNLYVSSNKLIGAMPSLANLTQLAYLYLDNNNFEGVLPADIGNATTHLLMVKLTGNSFSGAFPSSIGSCTSLTYLDAGSNKFSSLPSSLLSLPVITTLNLDNNNLTAVPDFSTHVNKANLTLTLSNNQLDFAQLEPQVGAGIHVLSYSPQKNITDVSNVTYFVNGALTIPARPSGQFSTVTWQKQQANGTWATINGSNNDGTQHTYLHNNAPLADEGTYQWSMTNTKVTGITLQSDPIVATSYARLTLNQWAFQYKYDGRKRMIAKRVPGADWVYMVYDDRDRLVLTQDGNQRLNNQWMVTKYDTLNRPVMTAIYTHSSALTQDQMSLLVSTSKFCEAYAGAAQAANHGYTLNVWPKTNLTVLTVSYYDNYNFVTDLSLGANYNFVDNDISGQQTTYNSMLKGHPTGGKVNVLGSANYLKSVTYYDDKYRSIQTIADNNKSGYDRTTNVIDFTGRVLNTKTTHHTSTHSDQTIARRMVYDHGSRVKQVFHNVNTSGEKLLLQNEYNEIGQLVDKKLYSTDNGATFKQSVDHRYNIRGWLTSINNSQLVNDGNTNDDTNDLFGVELGYNNNLGTGNANLYNGNISAMKWSSNLALGTVKDVGYNYTYDALNRITGASYLSHTSGAWSNPTNAFSESGYTYDLNGNIKNLIRNGSTGSVMDNMTYTYNGNQLLGVSDVSDKTKGFIDGANTDNDYTYDVNGNMVSDQNKSLSAGNAIQYNHLNLPVQVMKNTNEKIIYTYDATGRKLKQDVYNASGAITKTTDYDGEFIYQGDTLQFINHEEGRIVMKNGANEYQYHLKDHLGNVRLTFTSKNETQAAIATFETANYNTEQSQFLRMEDARVVNSVLFDHTHNGTTAYSERLTGSANEKTGIARSISVMPGDTITMEVYAKYVDGSNPNNTASLVQLLSQITSGSAGTVVDGTGYATNGITPFPFASLIARNHDNANAPKAYLNYLIFDRNFTLVDGGYVQMQGTAKEDGTNVTHEWMNQQVIIKQAGYVYIYLSNENPTPVEVYFDDFKVTQTKSPVVQMEDFYPFGLSFNSYSRENTVPQNFLYNGKEQINDLGLDWADYGARMYMPEMGRWGVVDPMADVYKGLSPYNYVMNNPLKFIDPSGMTVEYGDNESKKRVKKYSDQWVRNKDGSIKTKKNGEQVKNKNYNEAFAKIMDKLEKSDDKFVFNYNSEATSGSVKYDGENVNITIADPGEGYGAGADGIMFEEVKHSEQVLDGQVWFEKNKKNEWGTFMSIEQEYSAKKFVINQLGTKDNYTVDGFSVPTQLGVLKGNTADVAKSYLVNGVRDYKVNGDGGKTGNVTFQGAYAGYSMSNPTNPYTERTKTATVFAYPYKKPN